MTSGSETLPSFSEILAFNAGAAEMHCDHDVSVTFLRNFTIEGVEPFLTYHCLKSGIRPAISFGGFDTVLQDLIEPLPHEHGHPADIVVLALVLEQIDPACGEPGWRASGAIERLRALFQAAAAQTVSLLAVNTFIPPYDTDFGIAAGTGLSSPDSEVAALNRFIREFVLEHRTRFILLDWERMAMICGEQETVDYRFWYMSKAPFKQPFLNLYALEILKAVRDLKGRSRKCLLLDCDNTLWGGVVGEDGLAGIHLDRHSYPGNIFYDFQKQVLRLHDRGVLLALVTKNNQDDVWEVLERHPDCLIRCGHLAAWRINWSDKADNIRSIAEELNLGLDSFVFVDDSPVECDLVRAMLPEVAVIQVPAKLYTFPRLLSRAGLFDTLTVSAEDRCRSAMYRAEGERKLAEGGFASREEYLATLGMVATIRQAGEEDLERMAQLTQKTNQFNLTTRRYSAARIGAFIRAADAAVFSLSVSDRFGDSGLTGVMIAFRDGEVGRIDSFLLSCRILGRNLESVFLDHCLALLRDRWTVSEWVAEYIPSRRNVQTAAFYDTAGFSADRADPARTVYRCDAARRVSRTIAYITVKEVT